MTAPPLCIYCCARPADSEEHWWPEWLGSERFEGYESLFDRLCRPCNERLGKTVDQEMSRTGVEAFARYQTGVVGPDTDLKRSSPFTHRTQRADPPTEARMEVKEFGFPEGTTLLAEPIPGAPLGPNGEVRARLLRQLVLQEGEQVPYRSVPFPADKSTDWLRKALQQRELSTATLRCVFFEKGDGENLLSALEPLFPNVEAVDYRPTDGETRITKHTEINVRYPLLTLRGIAKTAFHYFLKVDEAATSGHEPGFAGIRRFIFDGTGEHASFVESQAREFLLADRNPPYTGHFLMVTSDRNNILRVFLQTFVSSGLPRVRWCVTLGRDEYVRQLDVAHVFRFFKDRSGPSVGRLVRAKVEPRGALPGLVVPWIGHDLDWTEPERSCE